MARLGMMFSQILHLLLAHKVSLILIFMNTIRYLTCSVKNEPLTGANPISDNFLPQPPLKTKHFNQIGCLMEQSRGGRFVL